jgi:pimeloyl-ACP methyl ester carboxylesterase
MFRDLIPPPADRYRVIAPDYLGFGLSDAPSVEEFEYSFDALADLVDKRLDQLGGERAAFSVQDYGAPVGWRLAVGRPERTRASSARTPGGTTTRWSTGRATTWCSCGCSRTT